MSVQKRSMIETHSKYEIIDKIGEGNYGTVFLARHQELGRDVAIKVLSGSKECLSDLQREAWVQGRLSHPNIISVHDFIVANGKGHLVMEYVEKSLQKTLEESSAKRNPVQLQFALRVIRECIEGLAHAHYARVVHGDIKPANILITSAGDVKISDFGVSRLFGTALKTKEGSARWAAPEVIKTWKREKVWSTDYQSDLFSIGVVSYLLLTGRHPFVDPAGFLSVEEVILRDDISPSFPKREGEIIPGRYASMTMRLIQRDKKQRYTSAEEALVDLQEHPMAPCLHCGDQNPEDASFCNWCGRDLKTGRTAALPIEERAIFEAHDLFTANQADKGIARIEELLESEKANAERWCGLGYKFNSFGWYKDAIAICTKAIELDPKLSASYQTRGFAKSCSGDFKGSITDFDKALEYVKQEDIHRRSQILYQRGYALMRMGKMPEACKDATESFKLDLGYGKASWLISVTCKTTDSKP